MATKLLSIDLLAHPLRLEIVRYISAHGKASPKILAAVLNVPVENMAYHVRLMKKMGVLEFDHLQPAGGSFEHFYRLNKTKLIDLADELLVLTNELRNAA